MSHMMLFYIYGKNNRLKVLLGSDGDNKLVNLKSSDGDIFLYLTVADRQSELYFLMI